MSEADDPRTWIHGDESAKEMLSRVLAERPSLLLPPLHRLPLQVGNVAEITGPSSSGKSQVLLQAAVQCILPKEWKGIRFGGLERMVIYFDLDCRFDVLRLVQVLKHRIMEVPGCTNNSNQGLQEGFQEYHDKVASSCSFDDDLLMACLRRFLYVRCYNSSDLLLSYWLVIQTMHSRIQIESQALGVGIHFLMIDSIGAFYWIDRSCQSLPSGNHNRKIMSFQNLVETIVQEIRKFLEVQPVLVLVSKASIFGAGTSTTHAQRPLEDLKQWRTSSRETEKLFREYMPPAWQAFVTHRIYLQASDKCVYNNKYGTSPIYTSEWVQPPLNIKDQFAIADDGIFPIM
ncbi:hypothetical protein Cni_G26648 [Canna indica]|uniref:RecA family profile 1 domain-containing protein n=1 Tax=Canna indica TaxID=4628 RepID=A0AAQ3L057_9LILI|nr:hypothetical protein Cni_G26648 [Canna indica]